MDNGTIVQDNFISLNVIDGKSILISEGETSTQEQTGSDGVVTAGDNRFVVRSEVAIDLAPSESGTEPDGVFVGECMLVEAFGDDENAIVGVCSTRNGIIIPSTDGELALVVGKKLHGLRDLLRAGLGDAAWGRGGGRCYFHRVR